MSSYVENLDIINTHIGGKRRKKARIERAKRLGEKITKNAIAFERAERGENNYESPPPALPSESANNVNKSLPGYKPPSPPPPPNNQQPPPPDNGFGGPGGPGGPGSFSPFSNFQGNSPNSVRLSPEDMQKLREAREAEEKEKAIAKEKEAKAKAEEESAFMQEIGHFIETGNRGTARSGQRNTARGRTKFENSKANENGKSAKKALRNLSRGERSAAKSKKLEKNLLKRRKDLLTGELEAETAANLETVTEASTVGNFVTSTENQSNGSAISTEDFNFIQFRDLLTILNREENELFSQILRLIKSYGNLFYQKGDSEELAEILSQIRGLVLTPDTLPLAFKKFLKRLDNSDLRAMILRLFGLTKLGKRLYKVASAASGASAAAPAINSKPPNIEERPAAYGKAAQRRTVNGRTEDIGIQAYTILTEGGPPEALKNFQFSERTVNPEHLNEKLLRLNAAKFRKSEEQKPNNASNEINKDSLRAKKIKFFINTNNPSGLKQEFEEFRKTHKGSKAYIEFAKLHQNLLESPANSTTELEAQPSLTTEPEPEPNIKKNLLVENEIKIPLKQLSSFPVPLLEVDFSSNSEKENKKKEILRIIRKHSLLHLFNQLLSTEVTISSVDDILDELYDDLTKFDELASKKRELSPNEEGELSLLSSRYEQKFKQINRSETKALIEKLSIINGSAKIDRLKKQEKEAKEAEEKSRRAELNRLSQEKQNQLIKKTRTESSFDIISKKKEIQRLLEKHKLTIKPDLKNLNVSEIYKDLREYDELKTAHPLYSVENSRNINAFLQKKYPEEPTIGLRAKRMTKNDLVNFFKTGRMEKGRMEKIFKKMEKEEERRRKENQEKLNQKKLNRERLTAFVKPAELTNMSFANAVRVSKKLPAVNSNKVSPITAPKPSYKNVLMKPSYKNILGKNKPPKITSNNKQQVLKKIDMIIEKILMIEEMKGKKNPSRLLLIEEIMESRLTENELLELYIILAENSLNLLSELNTRYKFEIKKLLKKINNKKYTKIIEEIEKSIKNELIRSTMPNVSSPTEESFLELSAVDPTVLPAESRAESPAESSIENSEEPPNNSSVNKLLDVSEKKFKILKKDILEIEKRLLDIELLEKEKLEQELNSILKSINKTNITKDIKAIKSEIEKLEKELLEKELLEKELLEKQTTKRRNLERIKSEIEILRKKLSEKNKERIDQEKKLANKLNSIWKNKSRTTKIRNPKQIQSDIEKCNHKIKLLESELRKKLKIIYEQFLNNLEGAKKAFRNSRSSMTNSKNELNKFKKINNFKELMKKLYDLFNYLVKKYKFYGEKIKKIIDNMDKYKDEYKKEYENLSKHYKSLLKKMN